jgi:hypothetical protein
MNPGRRSSNAFVRGDEYWRFEFERETQEVPELLGRIRGRLWHTSIDQWRVPFQARENVGVVVARGRMLSSVRPLMRQEDSRRPVARCGRRGVPPLMSYEHPRRGAAHRPGLQNGHRRSKAPCQIRQCRRASGIDAAQIHFWRDRPGTTCTRRLC